jgi:hypothetical protein
MIPLKMIYNGSKNVGDIIFQIQALRNILLCIWLDTTFILKVTFLYFNHSATEGMVIPEVSQKLYLRFQGKCR